VIRARRLAGARRPSPFAVLGLDPAAAIGDDDVRAAWRRIAADTHPDRADGGDPERFAAAAAAYTDLRTGYGRGEVLASLPAGGRRPAVIHPAVRAGGGWRLRAAASRLRGGRPVRLALRALGAAAAAVAGLLAAGHNPAGPALAVGALTWLALTCRRDLGPPPAG